MIPTRLARPPRGMALLPIILLVLALSGVAAFALKVSGYERAEAGKSVHNVSMQTMADTTLQLGRNFFAARYSQWGTYLSYFVANPVQLASRSNMATYVAKLKTDHPELFVALPGYLSANFDCFMYAQDNVDEFATKNDPTVDNDLLIYVGAVCAQRNQGGSNESSQLIAELTAPLLYSPTANIIQSQASGGSQGNNNDSKMNAYR
jgi:type IV secretory pathway TrbL component